MSKRLQVLLEDTEIQEIERIARDMAVDEWLRQTLEAASRRAAQGDVERKSAAVRAAVLHEIPTGPLNKCSPRSKGRSVELVNG